MSTPGPKYKLAPDDVAYDPIADLQCSLGGPDEHNALVRVVQALLLKIAAKERSLE